MYECARRPGERARRSRRVSEASEVWRGGREEKGNLRGNVKKKCKK